MSNILLPIMIVLLAMYGVCIVALAADMMGEDKILDTIIERC